MGMVSILFSCKNYIEFRLWDFHFLAFVIVLAGALKIFVTALRYKKQSSIYNRICMPFPIKLGNQERKMICFSINLWRYISRMLSIYDNVQPVARNIVIIKYLSYFYP